jgi:hypothetical protein
MKTMKINENLSLQLNEGSQNYDVKIDNLNKEVFYHTSEFNPISRENIQKLVDKLMKLGMITLIGGKNGEKNSHTVVGICIWEIDETEELYIETYHDGNFDDVSDFDRIMKYEDFLNN